MMHQTHDQEVQQVGELLANASKLRQLFSGEDFSNLTFPVFILVIVIQGQFYWQKLSSHFVIILIIPHYPFSQFWLFAGQTSVLALARVSPWFRLTSPSLLLESLLRALCILK